MLFSPEEINEFKGEAFDLLSKAEEGLLALEGGADIALHYDTIFRSFHNIKGAASIIEDEKLQAKMHELENELTSYSKKNTFSKETIDLLLQGVDEVRKILKAISPSANQKGQNGKSGQNGSPRSVVAEPTPFSESSLNEFLTECDEISQKLSLNFNKLETEGLSPEILDTIYRDIHSLKGSSQLFGFKQMSTVIHAMESSLDPIRKNLTPISSALMDSLYQGLDLVDRMVKSIRNKSNEDFQVESEDVISVLKNSGVSNGKKPESTKDSSHHPTDHLHSNEEAHPKEVESTTIRVPVTLLDKLMALVGEMVLVRNQVVQFSARNNDLEFLNLSQKLNTVTGEIQEEMMKTRMQPIGNILNKFHRIIRDLTKELSKSINLTLEGTETELDKTLLEAIKDPLTHIIRNSCDHGIEPPKERIAAGKPEGGSIQVRSYHEGGQVIVAVSDDGKGLDRSQLLAKAIEKGLVSAEKGATLSEREIFNFIFAPGFSTAAQVSTISGRGVGMDVVKSNIERIGGTVELESEKGKGTTIRLKIPLTLAIVPAMIVRSHTDRYAIPQVKLVELVRVGNEGNKIEILQGRPIYRLRGKLLPLLNLREVLGIPDSSSNGEPQHQTTESTNIVVLNADRQIFGLIVDEIQDTADIVVKPLARFLKPLAAYSGATVLGDGSVALILDVVGLAQKQLRLRDTLQIDNRENEISGEAKKKEKQAQDFILFNLKSPTKHAVFLSYVNRLEEFKKSSIEYSGKEKVIRYRNTVLPIYSLSPLLGYDSNENDHQEVIQVIVIQKGKRIFGLEVNEILETLSTPLKIDSAVANRTGILGNLVTDQEVIVVVDLDYVVSQAFKTTGSPPVGKILSALPSPGQEAA